MRPLTKNNTSYRQYSPITDVQLAEVFDDWFYNQPEEVRAVALGHVETLKDAFRNVGDAGAKATVMRLYAEILEAES